MAGCWVEVSGILLCVVDGDSQLSLSFDWCSAAKSLLLCEESATKYRRLWLFVVNSDATLFANTATYHLSFMLVSLYHRGMFCSTVLFFVSLPFTLILL